MSTLFDYVGQFLCAAGGVVLSVFDAIGETLSTVSSYGESLNVIQDALPKARCAWCGQWGIAKTQCKHCGQAIDL